MSEMENSSWKKQAFLFLLSQGVSLLGTSLVQYSILWYVTLKTGSGVMMTVYITAGFLPTFFLSPFAGVWADRYDRKKLIILSDSGIAAVTLAAALIFTLKTENIWILIAAAGLRAVGSAVQGPAIGAVLPQIVPGDKLMRVNGIMGTVHSVIGLGSPIISGILMSVSTMAVIFYIDVVTAAAAVSLLVFFVKIKPRENRPDLKNTSHLKDLMEGLRYIKRHRYLIPFFLYIAFFLFLVTPAAFLTPLQITRSYGSDVWRLTMMEVAFSLGMMAGSGLLAVWGGFTNRMHTMLLSTAMMALCTVFLGLKPLFPVYIGIMGFFGTALAFYNTPSTVILQEHVEDAFLGRIFSVSTMLFTSMMPIAMLFFGPVAEIVPIEIILIITGSLTVFLTVAVSFSRNLVSAGLPPE